jgi:hypothetical protein
MHLDRRASDIGACQFSSSGVRWPTFRRGSGCPSGASRVRRRWCPRRASRRLPCPAGRPRPGRRHLHWGRIRKMRQHRCWVAVFPHVGEAHVWSHGIGCREAVPAGGARKAAGQLPAQTLDRLPGFDPEHYGAGKTPTVPIHSANGSHEASARRVRAMHSRTISGATTSLKPTSRRVRWSHAGGHVQVRQRPQHAGRCVARGGDLRVVPEGEVPRQAHSVRRPVRPPAPVFPQPVRSRMCRGTTHRTLPPEFQQ